MKTDIDIRAAVIDYQMLIEIICFYEVGNFKAMKGLILEYEEKKFFTDLFILLQNQKFRNIENKFLMFVGITRQFFEIYT
jgi:hypothetical protein